MKWLSTKFVISLLATLLLLLVIAWMSGVFSNKLDPGQSQTTDQNYSDPLTVAKQEQAVFESVPATIAAKQTTIISSRILARIQKIHVRAGDMAIKGQLLIELEQGDRASRVSQADARVQSITARLTEAKQSLSRAIALTEKGLLSKSDLDRAQANHDALVADMLNAQQALNEAQTALNFAKVVAPINGRIVDRFAEPGDTAQPGVPLLSLYNPQSLRVEADVREELALSLHTGQILAVTVPALKLSLSSEIEEIVPAGNVGSRSFLIKSRFQQAKGLLPGMYAQLKIPAGTRSLFLIPEDRIAQVGQLDIVWVLKNDTLERRLIRTGKVFSDGMVEVVSGLAENERVVSVVQ